MRLEYIAFEDVPDAHPVAAVGRFFHRVADRGRCPLWSTFDPVDHPGVLKWVMLLRPTGEGQLEYVVCGSGCCEVFGFSYAGQRFGYGLPEAAFRERQREFDTAVAEARCLFTRTRLPIEGREHVAVIRGTFPFVSEAGELARIMVVLAPETERVPKRLS